MEFDNESLIAEVFIRRPLWKTNDIDYYNRDVIKKLWNEIANKLGHTIPKCKHRWRGLRNEYRCQLKRRAGLCGKKPLSLWQFYYQLAFLKPIMLTKELNHENVDDLEQFTNNSMESTVLNNTDPDEASDSKKLKLYETVIDGIESNESESNEFESESGELENEQTIEEYELSNERIQETDKPFIRIESIERVEESEIQEIQIEKVQYDDDEMFFRSLLSFMKELTPSQNLKVRNRIQNIILKELSRKKEKTAFSHLQNSQSP